MSLLLSALLAVSLLLVAQLALWRLWKPVWQYAVLPALALVVLLASLGIFRIFRDGLGVTSQFLPATAFDYWNFVILYAALVMAYFVTYPAIQADSPSMTIVLLIERAGSKGMTRQELMDELNDQVLVLPRIQDLVDGNLVRLDRGRYAINSGGTVLAKVHIFYRALLKMEKGG